MAFTELNPRTKLLIRDSIEEFLYQPTRKQIKRRIEELTVRNCRLLKSGHLHFVYKERTYNMDANPMPLRRNRLVAELRAPMEECLADELQVVEEMPFVMGFVTLVLNASNAPGDWLRIFPESTHSALKKAFTGTDIVLDWSKTHLPDDAVEAMRVKHLDLSSLMRQRMTINLLIS